MTNTRLERWTAVFLRACSVGLLLNGLAFCGPVLAGDSPRWSQLIPISLIFVCAVVVTLKRERIRQHDAQILRLTRPHSDAPSNRNL